MEAELLSFWKVLSWILGAIVLYGGAYNYIEKYQNKKEGPTKELTLKAKKLEDDLENHKRKVEEMEEDLREYTDEKFNNSQVMISKMNDDIRTMKVEINKDILEIKKELNKTQEENQLTLKALLAIGNHLVTNDSADKIKDVNDSIVEHLINKK